MKQEQPKPEPTGPGSPARSDITAFVQKKEMEEYNSEISSETKTIFKTQVYAYPALKLQTYQLLAPEKKAQKSKGEHKGEDTSKASSVTAMPPSIESTTAKEDTSEASTIASREVSGLKIKKSPIKICLTACRYESIRRVASAFGMQEVSDSDPWNYCWTDLSVSIEKAKELNRFQRINHFPGMLEICRKDLLARNLNRMQKNYPKEYNFFPKTWCLPLNFAEAISYAKTRKNRTFIIKPECGSQGRGIYLTKTLADIKPTDRLICQVYISKPYLVDGYKFDIRVYALITSCDPLRIYVYDEGLARFATSLYSDPNVINAYNDGNVTNVFMHLTNYAINKHSRTYVYDAQAGSKRKISTLNKILKSKGVDMEKLWHNIDQVIVKTVISAWPVLKHSYRSCFPTHDLMPACFEILGFDILLDHKLHPYLLEVNHSPSFHTDTQLDREVKEALLTDTFSMLNIWQCDRRRCLEEETASLRDRIMSPNKYPPRTNPEGEESVPYCSQVQWEESHLGHFRRVYPVGDKYVPILKATPKVYTEIPKEHKIINSSREKGDFAKQQPLETKISTKIEAQRKLAVVEKPAERAKDTASPLPSIQDEKKIEEKEKESKVKEKETNEKEINEKETKERERREKEAKEKETKEKEAKETKKKERESKSASDAKPFPFYSPPVSAPLKPRYVSCSYEPDPIVQSEEQARQTLMAQREFLIRSYGLLENIYLIMKKVGTLKPADERKYGTYGILQGTKTTKAVKDERRARTAGFGIGSISSSTRF